MSPASDPIDVDEPRKPLAEPEIVWAVVLRRMIEGEQERIHRPDLASRATMNESSFGPDRCRRTAETAG
jgi:hypothetical protein